MKDLIEKLEAATEGSRELDAEIGAQLGGGVASHNCSDNTRRTYGAGAWFTDADNMRAVLIEHTHHAPHYTTSLDAALTLVPEGYAWSLDFDPKLPGKPGRPYYADVTDFSTHAAKAWSTTPALALCIAALKAREVSA